MADQDTLIPPGDRGNAGHHEILGETSAKFEFFENGWNPYTRFLNVDKVDLILRRKAFGKRIYREVQVKFGKPHRVKSAWERKLTNGRHSFTLFAWRD